MVFAATHVALALILASSSAVVRPMAFLAAHGTGQETGGVEIATASSTSTRRRIAVSGTDGPEKDRSHILRKSSLTMHSEYCKEVK